MGAAAAGPRGRPDDPAGVHDGDLGGQLTDHGQVVADVDGRDPVAPAQAADGVEDMALRGDIEAGGGLVQDDERGPAGEGHSQRDALLLAARELMRVAPQQGRAGLQPDLRQHLQDPFPGITGEDGAGPARVRSRSGLVHSQHLAELIADPQRRVQRRRRVLRHVADPGPAHLAQASGAQPQQVQAVQEDLAAVHGQAPPGVPQQGQGDRGLAGPGLADQAEHVAGPHREGDPADHRGPLTASADLQVAHLQPEPVRVGGRAVAG